MVGGLVEQQDVRIGDQEAAERHAAAFTARERRDRRVGRRQAQRLHGHLDLMVKTPQVVGVDRVLQASQFIVQLVGLGVAEIAAEQLADRVIARQDRFGAGDALLDALHDGLAGVQLGLLREIADFGVLGDLALAHVLGVEAGQDFEQRGFARAVGADHADVRAVKKREVDVLEDGLLLVLLGDVDERECVFAGHDEGWGWG